MSSLNTFGAILSHAVELESQLSAWYTRLGAPDKAKAADKRRAKLERARRENVVEITLEPIEGLNADDYALDLSGGSAEAQATAAQVAARFYADVAPKINVRAAQRDAGALRAGARRLRHMRL